MGPTLKMGLTGRTETSVWNYHYSLRNNPEERSSGPKIVSMVHWTQINTPFWRITSGDNDFYFLCYTERFTFGYTRKVHVQLLRHSQRLQLLETQECFRLKYCFSSCDFLHITHFCPSQTNIWTFKRITFNKVITDVKRITDYRLLREKKTA